MSKDSSGRGIVLIPGDTPDFFQRGNGPLVSVLITTRSRPFQLAAAIHSCHDLARYPYLLEYVLKVDEDDRETIEMVKELSTIYPIKVFCSPRGRGYSEIAGWLDGLAKMATGDWLFILTDDFLVRTPRWDEMLLTMHVPLSWHGCVNDICMFAPEVNNDPFKKESIILRRKTFEILGHMALSCYADSWLQSVMTMVGSSFPFSYMKVAHLKEETVNFEMTQTQTLQSIFDLEPIREQMKDAGKLLDHIEKKYQASDWKEKPDKAGWWFVQREKPFMGKYFLALSDGTLFDVLSNGSAQTVSIKDLPGKWIPAW